VGGTLSEIVHLAPLKYDANAVQGLLIQIRRDSVGSHRTRLLDDRMAVNIAPTDIDQLASALQHKLTRGRVMTLPPSQSIDS
jgi:hypothetical protein